MYICRAASKFQSETDMKSGVVSVVLKRLEDAVMNGDPIKGVILNACTNHSAEAESITRPSLQAQMDIFNKVLDGLSPSRVSYVEMHGTGTQVGDATEMGSLLEVVAPRGGPHRRSETEVVHLGSVKTNLGHGEAAAGATSLVKLLLMMKKNSIPPHVGIKTRINHRFPKDMVARGVRIPSTPVDWNRITSCEPRYALLNNFSAAGGNTTLLLQDVASPEKVFRLDQRSTHVSALQANGNAILSFLQENPHLSVPSLSYTMTARRTHHSYRVAVAGSSLRQLTTGLSAALEQELRVQKPLSQTTIFAFTGQGSHYIGMGKELYHCLGSFKSNIDRYSRIALRGGFSPFLSLITQEGAETTQGSSEASQLAIVSLQMALVRLWASWGIIPSGVIGHSLGHYAALCAAGVISEADTIFLVGTRAQIMRDKCTPGTHKMLSVRASQAETSSIFSDADDVEIACINGPREVVLTGPATEIDRAVTRLVSDQKSCRALDVPYAFHSSQVTCMLDDFEEAISGVKFHPPRIPVICPRKEKVLNHKDEFSPVDLVDHFRRQVNMVAALEAAHRERLVTDNTIFLEIGHSGALTSMLKGIFGSLCIAFPSLVKNRDAWGTLVPALNSFYKAGYDLRWDEYHRDFMKTLHVISIPHYQWDLQDYWIPYRNNWSLRKGDAVPRLSGSGLSLLSTTIHKVVKEEPLSGSHTIILHSDLVSPVLCPIVQGHKVNGIPLATPVGDDKVDYCHGHC